MIKSFALQNFKKYVHQDIDIEKKLTILVGPNSSGKSSLLKAPLAFKQTYEDQSDHSGFLARGEYVDIGPFVEYVHDHHEKNRCRFVFHIQAQPRTRGLVGRRLQPSNAWISICHENDPGSGHGRLFEYAINLDEMPDENDIHDLQSQNRFILYRRMQKAEETFKIYMSKGMHEYIAKALANSPIKYNALPSGSFPDWKKHARY